MEFEITVHLTEEDTKAEQLVIKVATRKQAIAVVESLKSGRVVTVKQTKDIEF